MGNGVRWGCGMGWGGVRNGGGWGMGWGGRSDIPCSDLPRRYYQRCFCCLRVQASGTHLPSLQTWRKRARPVMAAEEGPPGHDECALPWQQRTTSNTQQATSNKQQPPTSNNHQQPTTNNARSLARSLFRSLARQKTLSHSMRERPAECAERLNKLNKLWISS